MWFRMEKIKDENNFEIAVSFSWIWYVSNSEFSQKTLDQSHSLRNWFYKKAFLEKTSQLPVGNLMALIVTKIHGNSKEDKLKNRRDILSCYWPTVTMCVLHSPSVYLNMCTSLGFGGCLCFDTFSFPLEPKWKESEETRKQLVFCKVWRCKS